MSGNEKNTKIFKNASYLTISRILGDIFTFILFVVIARVYGTSGLGQYSFAMGLASFLIVFVDYGLTNYSIKELSKKNAFKGDHYGGILSIRLIMSVFVCLFLVIILPFIPIDGNKEIILYISISQVLLIIIESLSAILIARQDLHIVGIMDFFYKLFSSIAIIIPALLGQSLIFSLAMLPIAGAIYLLLIFKLVSKKYGRPNVIASFEYYRNTLKEAFTFAVFILLHKISTRTDIIIIGIMLNTASVGIYNGAYRIIFMLMLFAYFCELALMPVATNLYHSSKDELTTLYNNSFSIIMLIAIPLSAGIWLTSKDIISLIYGNQFIESSIILDILAWLVLLAFIKSIIGVFLTSCEMQHHRTRGQWVAAILNVAGTILLIPILGIIGAAIATIISEVVLIIINGLNLKQVIGAPRIHKHIFMGSIGSLVFCVIILSIGELPIFITIPLAILIYFSVLMIFKDFRKHEYKLILQFIGRS